MSARIERLAAPSRTEDLRGLTRLLIYAADEAKGLDLEFVAYLIGLAATECRANTEKAEAEDGAPARRK